MSKVQGHSLGPTSLDAILEAHGVQPFISWMKLSINDRAPGHHHLIMVLFDDGTVIVNFPENIDFLGAIAYAHVGY